MPISPFTALACPLDGKPLQREGGSWRCADGHVFDIASQGYTHLLPVQNKRSRDPGDSKEMVAARRRFLTAGYYAPIAAAVNRAVLDNLPAGTTSSCLDAGCGEGYYLRQLAAALPPEQHLSLLGLDISKWAVQAAARAEKQGGWVVGTNARLPVLAQTLDCVLCLFGFPVYPEFARVLKHGGVLVQVDAGPDHLRELREIIYPVLKAERKAAQTEIPGFVTVDETTVRFSVAIEAQESIADLLAMTPHLYRATPEGRARAAALNTLNTTAEVKIVVWRRMIQD